MTAGVLSERTDRLASRVLIVGVAAMVFCLIGAIFDPVQYFRAYLLTYLFVLGLALGSLALVMIHHLTGGAWGLVIGRIIEAQMKTLPLLALLFVPVVIGLPHV